MRGRRHRQCHHRRGALTRFDVLILSTGHAGASPAVHLRQAGFAGSVALISEEAELPYERPPLSKDYPAGTKAGENFRFRASAFWTDKGIELVPGERVEVVDRPPAPSTAPRA